MVATSPHVRVYDMIAFGDEVPGILALVCAAREYRQRHHRYPRSLLMFKGNSRDGVGGHLVRGGLSYLDRSHVPPEIRRAQGLDTFGDPAAIYKEFLKRSEVKQIALGPRLADSALRAMLQEAQVSFLSNIEIESVKVDRDRLHCIRLTNGDTYQAQQFIDATVNAELAQFAGVPKYPGFGVMGLPEAELSVTLTFETEGLSIDKLKRTELHYLHRFADVQDAEAQSWLNTAAGSNGNSLAPKFAKCERSIERHACWPGLHRHPNKSSFHCLSCLSGHNLRPQTECRHVGQWQYCTVIRGAIVLECAVV